MNRGLSGTYWEEMYINGAASEGNYAEVCSGRAFAGREIMHHV